MYDDSKLRIIDDEIRYAGIGEDERKRLVMLDGQHIDEDTVIEPQEYLFQMNGKPCFPVGELVAVTGKQKAGKTFFCSMLIALAMRREVMGIRRISPRGLRVMWIDTEQSRQTTQKILKQRIRRMIDAERLPQDQIRVFNLRANNWKDRLGMVETAVRWWKPDLVVLDGIRDLIDDINDHVKSSNLVTRLSQLSSGYTRTPEDGPQVQEWQPCCMVCVLHQNKAAEDKTLRGATGTELFNKCFEGWECSKDIENLLFTVTQVATREYDIKEPLRFRVDDDGLPRLLSYQELADLEADGGAKCEQGFTPQKNLMGYNPEYMLNDELDYRRLFDELLPFDVKRTATELRDMFMKRSWIKKPIHYNEYREKAVAEHLIESKRIGRYVYYFINRNFAKEEGFVDEQMLIDFGRSDEPI